MPRPARFDADELLDHAVALTAAEGPAAVTMARVARAAGAPSGSVYYRFPSRAELLAALWLRTVGRFQDGFLEAIEAARTGGASGTAASAARAPGHRPGGEAPARSAPHDADATDPLAACAAGARFTVEWSRSHAGEAHVLLHGAGAFEPATWPDEARRRSAARVRRVEGALRALARDLGRDDAAGRERVTLAVVDVPYALVRRHLRARTPIPDSAGDLVEEAARAVLASRPAPTR
jgi:AcrR family transcriptional regulator